MICFFIGKRNKKIEYSFKKLGFDKVYFVKEVSKLKEIRKEDKSTYNAFLIKTKGIEMLRRMVDKASNYISFILVLGINDEINRITLEHKKVRALVSPEYKREKDFLHYRNSGLNQVLCKIARDNDKIIIENFSDFILESKDITKALILGRMIQNARLCKKYKTRLIIGNFVRNNSEFRSKYDLETFKRILFV
ncbi:MAG: hypothetical protein IB618_00055 [Candidatus Pacearchaeota archaeon]|nr:MAG: hypothetical protein IB618_00055 [Candidatus Pacearchaeota archaeon]